MIREVKRSEIDVLCELSRQTFIETFAAVIRQKICKIMSINPTCRSVELVKSSD